MTTITTQIILDEAELRFTFIRSPGPGGQNVNKLATTAVLHFDVKNSPSLPDNVKQRLIILAGNKLNSLGYIIIKASRFRTQERNKHDAIARLTSLIRQAAIIPKKRKKTKPSFASVQQRLSNKKMHAKVKTLRRKKCYE